jgi:hypothetical protein
MIHHRTNDSLSGEHYAVGENGEGLVLLQVQDSDGRQSRARLTPEQARYCAKLLEEAATKAERG